MTERFKPVQQVGTRATIVGNSVVISETVIEKRPFKKGRVLLGRAGRSVDTAPWTTGELQRGARIRS